jgi:hypothetical protein
LQEAQRGLGPGEGDTYQQVGKANKFMCLINVDLGPEF